MVYDYLIVGAGFTGSVCAQVLAEAGKKIFVIDIRPHVGGNAYDRYDENGILIHKYGPHIFHTNDKRVFTYLSRFTDWRFYEHRVLAYVDGSTYPIPINRTTINKLYGFNLTQTEVEKYLESVRETRENIQTSEDVVLNSVGRDLCEKFFSGYTKKQWGVDLSMLSPGVAARIPTRSNDDDRYFTDIYQYIPSHGYAKIFEKLLGNKNITLHLSTGLDEIKNMIEWRHLIYTGPIDAYYGFCYGKLPYRSLCFEHIHLSGVKQFQPVGTVNYPNDYDFTRITEFKHLTGQEHSGTSIVKEYPASEGDPYYPVPSPQSEQLFKRYKSLASNDKNVTFIGRLAQYRYYNMDQVVDAAIQCAENLIENHRN